MNQDPNKIQILGLADALKATLIYRFPSAPLISPTPLVISLLKKPIPRDISKEISFVIWLCWKCLVDGEVLTIQFYLLTLEFFIIGSAAESKGLGFICT